jgi:hypothetical protein
MSQVSVSYSRNGAGAKARFLSRSDRDAEAPRFHGDANSIFGDLSFCRSNPLYLLTLLHSQRMHLEKLQHSFEDARTMAE